MSFLDPLFEAVAWVIIKIHAGLSLVFEPNSGWAWGLSIILLTVLMRILIFPLFVKQLHASRKMQELNPKVQELRKKYKNDKQRLNQEVMKLYQEAGANPLSGCLPLLAQFPIFISLFQVLQAIAAGKPKYGIDAELMASAKDAHIFGALISSRFLDAFPEDMGAMIVTGIAVLISSTTTFFMMKASVKRSLMTTTDTDNPMMNIQKTMVYFTPLFGLFGLGFPLGVLMYWATSNTWTLAQSHYIYKKYPAAAPGADGANGGNGTAATGTKAKTSAQSEPKGLLARLKKEPEAAAEPEPEAKVVRQQPVRQSRSKRTGTRKR